MNKKGRFTIHIKPAKAVPNMKKDIKYYKQSSLLFCFSLSLKISHHFHQLRVFVLNLSKNNVTRPLAVMGFSISHREIAVFETNPLHLPTFFPHFLFHCIVSFHSHLMMFFPPLSFSGSPSAPPRGSSTSLPWSCSAPQAPHTTTRSARWHSPRPAGSTRSSPTSAATSSRLQRPHQRLRHPRLRRSKDDGEIMGTPVWRTVEQHSF